MSSIQLGKTTRAITDDEFASGFQTGYLHFKADFRLVQITDDLVYTATFCLECSRQGYLMNAAALPPPLPSPCLLKPNP